MNILPLLATGTKMTEIITMVIIALIVLAAVRSR